METASTLALWVAGIAAGLAGLGYIGRKVIQGVRAVVMLGRKLDVLGDLALYELQHNSGHSIKDAVMKIPALEEKFDAIDGKLDRHLVDALEQRAEISARFEAVESERARTIANLAEALPVVAKSTPPSSTPDVEENGDT